MRTTAEADDISEGSSSDVKQHMEVKFVVISFWIFS
ncbi:hypothetical protein MADA3029_940231 [Vibrio nigripulchritudo MADA3029]|nr:hypothetical protein VIBNIMADA3021_1230228 [Vibrio nigripulchritudo MADA3021]CCN62337.1 hypothetical protein MADA3029_940231 [Vibrio nigripulchritudo MADA3029]